MHPFHEYLSGQLDAMLAKRRVVVFYDPRREFEPFFERELEPLDGGTKDLQRVQIDGRATHLARFEGSYFALRNAVERIAGLDKPERLILYLPGVKRDRRMSLLMELEKGGSSYEPALRALARKVLLRIGYSDVQIDQLKLTSARYDDIVSSLQQSEQGTTASVLRTIFDGAQSESLLANWLADDGNDKAVAERNAEAELFELIESRLGLPVPEGTRVSEARIKAQRYVLLGEFRSDLQCEPPPSVAMVPRPPSPAHVERIRAVNKSLRRDLPDRYTSLADQVETELGLGNADLNACHLGNIDTFRFEERALLAHAGQLICAREYESALEIVAVRGRSFWLDRDVRRQEQWKACGLVAELGREIERVRPALDRANGTPAKWVRAYSDDGGWFRIDELQRRVETRVAALDDEPEVAKALAVVRREHEELLKKMATGFARALGEAAWTLSGVLHQTHVYPEIVQNMAGRVAYFVVDAMRFEMGVDLTRRLEGTRDLAIRPGIAALPTITPVGMAALLPGASSSFAVVERKGTLAASIEGSTMSDVSERLRFLKARVPDVADIPLGWLLNSSRSKLSTAIGDASLVVVRSQEIDALGENVDEITARAAMEGVIGNVARAIRKLAAAGIESFVVTADHGHQFSVRKDDDMKTDNPGGDTVDIHRRCWIGRGGTSPPGTVRVTGAELGYETDLDFVFPTGLGVFKTGGSLSFHHGGVSLQELVIPVVSLRIPLKDSRAPSGKSAQLRGVPDRVTNRIFLVQLNVSEQMELSTDPDAFTTVQVVLVAAGEEVGRTAMATGGELDELTGFLRVRPKSEANVGMRLMRDECTSVRVVVLDPATDAVLDQSDELPVKLGI